MEFNRGLSQIDPDFLFQMGSSKENAAESVLFGRIMHRQPAGATSQSRAGLFGFSSKMPRDTEARSQEPEARIARAYAISGRLTS